MSLKRLAELIYYTVNYDNAKSRSIYDGTKKNLRFLIILNDKKIGSAKIQNKLSD